MPQFDWADLFNPKKIILNAPWVFMGAIGGIFVYSVILPRLIVMPAVGAINIKSPTMTPTFGVTPTYGCAGCGETGAIKMFSPSDTPKY